ncbi:MAG TPA: type VI secretion system tip protein VgrG [Puia sp.]|jgi:Rhs element Vgr protein|nr:type VI secretion system tip protein VgrG [Puia sp.]
MPQQIFIPNTSQHNVVTYQVLINGKVADPTYELLSMNITREMNRIPMVRLIFKDGDPSVRTFALSEAPDFVPGTPVAVKLGRDGTNTQVFKGIIVRHAIRAKENGHSELILDCKDEAVRMTVGRHSKYYTQQKDSDLLDTLVNSYQNLKCNMDDSKLQREDLVQHHCTDWDFTLMRAEANNMLVSVIDGTVNIAVPQTNGSPVVQVAFGSSLLEFEAMMDARTQYQKVEAQSWDYHNQQLFEADTSAISSWTEPGNIKSADLATIVSPQSYELHHSGYLTAPELQAWVTAQKQRSLLAKICGRAKITGFSGVKPGDLVTVTGVGARFNGNVFVTAVRHEVGDGIWDTHIQFGLDNRRYAELYQDISDAQAAGLRGGISGLQIGVTVKLQGDPDGQDRIQVRLPMVDNKSDGIWVRVASLDAGKDRGAFFRPEIGDEVIVGFINDDPGEGVVLGMLNSSAKPAPVSAQDSNDIKGFTTRSKMHITFDDSKSTITIDTPNKNTILLDDSGTQIKISDQNQNSITMDSSGITITSGTGNITIQASAGQVGITAGTQFSASGLTASLQGQTSASIQATTVMIN